MAAGAMGNGTPSSKSDIAQLTSLGFEMGAPTPVRTWPLNAEDYMQTDAGSVVVTHADYLDYVRERTADLIRNGVSSLSIDCDNIEVRLYGDAAVVTGGWTYIVQNPDGSVARGRRLVGSSDFPPPLAVFS